MPGECYSSNSEDDDVRRNGYFNLTFPSGTHTYTFESKYTKNGIAKNGPFVEIFGYTASIVRRADEDFSHPTIEMLPYYGLGEAKTSGIYKYTGNLSNIHCIWNEYYSHGSGGEDFKLSIYYESTTAPTWQNI